MVLEDKNVLKDKNKMIEIQKKLIICDKIIKNFVDKSITKEELLEYFDKPRSDGMKIGPFNIAPIHLQKELDNTRQGFDIPDIELEVTQRTDNGLDAHLQHLFFETQQIGELLIIKSLEDGDGFNSFEVYLGLAGDDKNRFTPSIGGNGTGKKLGASKFIIYAYTETKTKDGTPQAAVWFHHYGLNRTVYIKMNPQGKIITKSGTYEEVYILKSAIDDGEGFSSDTTNADINEEIVEILKDNYRTYLLAHPMSFKVHDNYVLANHFPDSNDCENKLTFKNHEGSLYITKKELAPTEVGVFINIYGRDLVPLPFTDFGFCLPSNISNRTQVWINGNDVKSIMNPTKDGFIKDRKGYTPIWLKFRGSVTKEIDDFLREKGYYEEETILSGANMITAELNRDLKYLIKNNSDAKYLFDALKTKTDKTPVGDEGGGKGGINEYTEKREGKGSVRVVVILEDKSIKKGFDINTPSERFFDIEKPIPELLAENDEVTLKFYKKVPGQKMLIRLTENVTVKGPYAIIDNLPLNTYLVVKACTTYGNSRHTYETLGRPKGYLYLTNKKPFDYVVIAIGNQTGIKWDAKPSSRVEHAFVNDITPDDNERIIIVNTSHEAYSLNQKQGNNTLYIYTLTSIIWAVAQTVDDEEEKKKKYKDMCSTLNERRK